MPDDPTGPGVRRATPVPLRFAGHPDAATLRHELSSLVQIGDELWVGSDEGATVERLTPAESGGYALRAVLRLADLVDLPGANDDEIDVEGLDAADGWLWIVGSHAARRADPADADPGDVADAHRRLARVRRRGNRYLLARVPLVRDAAGDGWTAVREAPPAANGDPGVNGEGEEPRRAARLRGTRRNDALTRALRHDAHFAPFLDVPGKDNGLDVEGIAVGAERVLLGLRGPVLRGWAAVLGLAPEAHPRRPDRLRLRRLDPHGRRYDKHFLDLRGLGVRDLCRDGDDLLVLAGPTMVLDGRAAVFRWVGGARATGDSLVPRSRLERVLELPYGVDDEGIEHPEGLTIVRFADGTRGLLVVYDAPHSARQLAPDGVSADLFPLP